MTALALHSFIHDLSVADLPDPVICQGKRCLLDLTATAAAGLATPLSRIIRDHGAEQFGAGAAGARMMLDGRRVSPAGAALAGGMTIDSFDAHDGHVLTKGHAGAAALPGLLACLEATDPTHSGGDFLTALVIGYEVAIRAGIATHQTAPDYHTSGSWNALGVAALAARLLGLDRQRTRHALGIAEYHGPRSQMMRCIDHPTMLKDGSGWGAMTGISAAYLARDGFTGAPALVVESDGVAALWRDLGSRWRILEMYFKPHPVCRWAQPAIEAALRLRREHGFAPEAIEAVEVHSFHEATRLDRHRPATTEEAQYSLPFPVAAALVRGALCPTDVSGSSLSDSAVLAVSDRITLIEDSELSARFPAERYARVVVRFADGRALHGEAIPARGDAERPLADGEIAAKFWELTVPVLGPERSERLAREIDALPGSGSVAALLDLVLAPVSADRATGSPIATMV